MDKLADTFKAIIAVFHGIIATWFFLQFAERSVDEFHFIILLIFFTTINILIWRTVKSLVSHYFKMRRKKSRVSDILATNYHASDVVVLTIISIIVGLTSAYFDKKDAILSLVNSVIDTGISSTDTPYEYLVDNITEHTIYNLDRRPPALVQAAMGAYVRVYVKDTKIGYEGYPGVISGKLDAREMFLSPACYFSFDGDPKRISAVQPINGPGVFLSFATIGIIEIIDLKSSECARLFVN